MRVLKISLLIFMFAPICLGSPLPGEPAGRPKTVLPETTTNVRLSSTDINRLECPENIKDVVFSKEKGIKVKIDGKNAFIKFEVLKKGSEMIYSEVPSEFYVVCGGDVYTLIGMPQRIPAQTIHLDSGAREKIEKNQSIFKGMPLESEILTLIRQSYTDRIPDSYTVRRIDRELTIFPALRLTFKRKIDVEGEGLDVREYAVALKPGTDHMRLIEQDFLKPQLTRHPLAIAVSELLLKPGERSRVFIVERRDPDPVSVLPPPPRKTREAVSFPREDRNEH